MSKQLKKLPKSKFLMDNVDNFIDDALNGSQFINEQPKGKASQKRSGVDELAKKYPTKKKREEIQDKTTQEIRGKFVSAMEQQIDSRKQLNKSLLQGLSDVIQQMEADCEALRNNQQKFQHLAAAVLKCMDQAKSAHENKLQSLSEIFSTFKNQCDEVDSDHKNEADKLATELEDDIRKLQQKLMSDAKKSGWENLQKKFFQAMQSDL